jgi:hypothetical protein
MDSLKKTTCIGLKSIFFVIAVFSFLITQGCSGHFEIGCDAPGSITSSLPTSNIKSSSPSVSINTALIPPVFSILPTTSSPPLVSINPTLIPPVHSILPTTSIPPSISYVPPMTLAPSTAPDLVINSLTASTDHTLIYSLNIYCVVKNIGSQKSDPTALSLKVGNETTAKTYSVPALSPGETFQVSRTEIYSSKGSAEVIATVDVNNNINELNENNNLLKNTFSW